MMSNNKILTVSYGTFSCTLEGFEDSFETMKVIAEYFRDLAQEDRYFGAEPPKPDAEMLARIAEREVARRVEARTSEAGIHLRADHQTQEASPATRITAAPATFAPIAAASVSSADTAEAHEDATPERDATPKSDVTPDVDFTPESDMGSVETQTDLPSEATDAPTADEISGAVDVVEETPAPEQLTETLDASIAAVMTDAAEAPEDNADTPDDAVAAAEEVVEAPETSAKPQEDATDEDVIDDVLSVSADVTDVEDDTPENEAAAPEVAADAEPVVDRPAADDLSVAEPVAEIAPRAGQVPVAETSIAAKLQRIRDVVAKNKPEANGYDEDQHASEMMEQQPVMSEDSHEEDDFSGAGTSLEAEVEAPEETAPETDADLTDALVAQTLGMDAEEDVSDTFDIAEPLTEAHDVNDAEHEPADAEDDATSEAIDEFVPTLDTQSATSDQSESTSSDLADVFEADEDDSAEFDADDLAQLAAALDPDTSAELETESEPSPETPRDEVIAVPRAELEQALNATTEIEDTLDDAYDDLEADVDENVAADLDAANAQENPANSTLSDEDEAELLRELAAVEAELPDEIETSTLVLEDADDVSEITPDTPRSFDQAGGFDESDLDRLMAEADNQMEEPEGSSRRDAFNHLRAAVAATKADDKLSEEARGVGDDDEYRTDLAAAVKPRRPVAGGGRSARPATHRPAPLKLVAEQRIDPTTSSSGPVRPRRIAASLGEDIADEGGSFADYAVAQGATELPDLLEAAASYLSFVEGREQFSRPQLMTKVRQVGHEDFTREDGLRSFGKLLRAGKIEKIKGGRFTVSDDIGFRPDERAAG